MSPKHLPYTIDPESNRFHYYENYWKVVGLRLLAKHVQPQGRTLLDYGCGRGETLKLAAEMGFAPSGTDTDPECVRLSGAHGSTSILNTQDPVGQFGRKSYDDVTCFHVLEHVENPKRTLNDIAAIAREHVLLAVPNLRRLEHIGARRFELSSVNEGHLQSWDHWHLRSLAERHCGLELIEWGQDATILPVLSNVVQKVFGNKFVIKLETGLFRRMFPYHGNSVIGLFRVRPSP